MRLYNIYAGTITANKRGVASGSPLKNKRKVLARYLFRSRYCLLAQEETQELELTFAYRDGLGCHQNDSSMAPKSTRQSVLFMKSAHMSMVALGFFDLVGIVYSPSLLLLARPRNMYSILRAELHTVRFDQVVSQIIRLITPNGPSVPPFPQIWKLNTPVLYDSYSNSSTRISATDNCVRHGPAWDARRNHCDDDSQRGSLSRKHQHRLTFDPQVGVQR